MTMNIIMPQIKSASIIRKHKMEMEKDTPIKMKVMKKDVVMTVGSFPKIYLMI